MPRTEGKNWSRLLEMSGAELRSRVCQEVSKRFDGAVYGPGRPPKAVVRQDQNCASGRFFFLPAELPDRVRLLQENLPHEIEATIAEAEEICRHRFRLLGYDDLNYGPKIDWHLDVVHGKRSPLLPWFKINFLDFEQTGDHKITWELNRHQHLLTLAKAWLYTREDRFVNEAIAQWYSWQGANPYPLGVNWASSLEVAFRTLSWLWLRELLVECSILPANFQIDLLRALALNGRHIDRYLSTYFSPNTHLLGEAVALYFMGTLCPQISSAGKWRKEGWRILQNESRHQVLPDGVYFEQSLYYHVYALDFLLHARLLAMRNAVEVPLSFDEVIRKMLAVVQALAQVAPPHGFGDDDGGRVFNPGRNRAEHMADPLPIGATLFHDVTLCSAARLTEEAVWLFGREALDWTTKAEATEPKVESRCFADGGLYLSASQEPFPQQLIIDAGPQSTGSSGHGHADALSLNLSFGDQRWLVDAGTFVYIGPGSERQAFRGTQAHNTLAVDRLDQAKPKGPFAWSALPVTRAESWIPAIKFSFFAASHSGYERLAHAVRHRRFVFHLYGAFWLIRDVAEGEGSHLLETNWHFAPGLEIASEDNLFQVSVSEVGHSSAQHRRLTLLPISDPRWRCEAISGLVSPAYGSIASAPILRCSARVELPAEHAMLLVPTQEQEACNLTRVDKQSTDMPETVIAYQYENGETAHTMIFGRSISPAWKHERWKSDAQFLYCCIRNRQLERLIFCEGSFLQFEGESLITRDSVLEWIEWSKTGPIRIFSSEESMGTSINTTALESAVFS